MQEPTREQSNVAEEMAAEYGRSAFEAIDLEGRATIIGLVDDIEMRKLVVDEDGTVLQVIF